MTDAIRLHNVSKHYHNGRGISGVELSVTKGEIFGFLGPNGAGKTTTIRCIMDFIRPDSGSVTIFGNNVASGPEQTHKLVGYLPSEPQLYPNWTGHRHIELYRRLRGADGVLPLVKRLDLSLDLPAKHLSSGNKQKLGLVLAMIGNPQLLIMDEPTRGLDPLLQQTIYEILNEYRHGGGTVFFSSHNLPEVEKVCDRIGVLKDGHIIANESLQSIRNLSVHIITAFGSTPFKPDSFQGKNVEIVHHSGNHIILKVRGDLNATLKQLMTRPLKDLEIAHANLEDVFMEFYK
jgi:ABC-2 type transport system ATP-binding protein